MCKNDDWSILIAAAQAAVNEKVQSKGSSAEAGQK